MKLEDITIIVTGATGTIGRVLAIELTKLGCDCICHYNKNQAQSQQLIEQIKTFGVKALSIQADLSDEKQITDFWNKVETFNDKPKVLLNTAGVFQRVSLEELTAEKIDETFDINFKATALMCKSFDQLIKKQNVPGKIINFAGVGAIRPWAKYSVYCASKAAIIAFTKSLAKELAPDITANIITPGLIEWQDNDTEDFKKKQIAMIPLGRVGKSEDIVSAVKFLIENDYTTGAEINVDGGRSL